MFQMGKMYLLRSPEKPSGSAVTLRSPRVSAWPCGERPLKALQDVGKFPVLERRPQVPSCKPLAMEGDKGMHCFWLSQVP